LEEDEVPERNAKRGFYDRRYAEEFAYALEDCVKYRTASMPVALYEWPMLLVVRFLRPRTLEVELMSDALFCVL